jgi:hypothetical protein
VVLVGFYFFICFFLFSVSFVLLVYLGVPYAFNGTFNYLQKKKKIGADVALNGIHQMF